MMRSGGPSACLPRLRSPRGGRCVCALSERAGVGEAAPLRVPSSSSGAAARLALFAAAPSFACSFCARPSGCHPAALRRAQMQAVTPP